MKRIGRTALLTAALALVGIAPAVAHEGGYGPTPPGQPGTPGSAKVLGAAIIGDQGGTLTAVVCPDYTATVTVAAGVLPNQSTVEITDPGSAQGITIANGIGVGDLTPLCVFTITVLDSNGTKLPGPFSPPITVTVTGPGIGAATIVGQQVAGGDTTQLTTTNGDGTITFTFDVDPSFALFNPGAAAPAPVAGRALPRTGRSIGTEFVIANLVLLAGGVLIVLGIRARRAMTRP